MTAMRSILIGFTALASAGALAACDPAAEPGEAPGEAAASGAEPVETAGPDGERALTELEVAARSVCAAGDEGFAAQLPDGTGFASRGPDARVHAAWSVDGEVHEAIVYTPSLEMEARLTFDRAVADFMRRNLEPGVDRSGLTGAYRYRDGRFCVVQTEAEAISGLQSAVRDVEAVLANAGE